MKYFSGENDDLIGGDSRNTHGRQHDGSSMGGGGGENGWHEDAM